MLKRVHRGQKKNHSCSKITKIIISSNITIFITAFSCQNSSVQRRRNISVTAADRRVAPAQRTATPPAEKDKKTQKNSIRQINAESWVSSQFWGSWLLASSAVWCSHFNNFSVPSPEKGEEIRANIVSAERPSMADFFSCGPFCL